MTGAQKRVRPSLVGYPANFLVAGRRCIVVGAGRIAQRKIEGLLTANADVVVVAPEAVGSKPRSCQVSFPSEAQTRI